MKNKTDSSSELAIAIEDEIDTYFVHEERYNAFGSLPEYFIENERNLPAMFRSSEDLFLHFVVSTPTGARTHPYTIHSPDKRLGPQHMSKLCTVCHISQKTFLNLHMRAII